MATDDASCAEPPVQVAAGPGLGNCLFATRPISAGELVLTEVPLLLAVEALPPLAVYAPFQPPLKISLLLEEVCKDETNCDYDAVGGKNGGSWPAHSTFDVKHFGLVLEFMNAPTAVRVKVLSQMQGHVEPWGGGNLGDFPGLPTVSAAAVCCAEGAAQRTHRGGPWDTANWELEPEVLAFCPAEKLLELLLLIFTINGHAFQGGAALFDLATKLTHSCGAFDVEYTTFASVEGASPRGIFRAVRDIPVGQLLTTTYLEPSVRRCSTPQRRRILYCQKGFVCLCAACRAAADPFRCGREETVADGVALGWLGHPSLQEERRLSGEAACLSHSFEKG